MRKERFSNGIVWFASWDIRALPERGRPPLNVSPQTVQKLENGNYLICECWDVVEVTPEHEIVWQFGEWGREGSDDAHLKGASSAWLYEDRGTVLIADTGNDRVLEVDKRSKRIVRKVEAKRPASAFLDPSTGNVIVASREEHCVREITWEGKEVWRFGVPGEPGWDEAHLREPWFAHPAKSRWAGEFDAVLVSDYGNHRILLVRKSDGEVVRTALSTGPECAFQTHNLGLAATGQIVAYLADQDWHVRWFAPDNWRLVPTHEGTVIMFDRVNVVEVDPLRFRPESALPGTYRLLTRYSLSEGEAVGPVGSDCDFADVPPLPAFAMREGLTLWAKATGRATIHLLTAKVKWSWAPTVQFDGWEEFEERALEPGKVCAIEISSRHAFLSAKIVALEDGQLDLWASW